jgi:hypothetical protein
MPEEVTDLSFVPTSELAAEFISRFDEALVIGRRSVTDDIAETYRRWDGASHMLLGLCYDMQQHVWVDWRDQDNDAPPHDDTLPDPEPGADPP